MGIELLVEARCRRTPQIKIEETRQLVRCRQCHQLAAVLQPTMLDDTLSHITRQPGH
jgi:hypothetical protein